MKQAVRIHMTKKEVQELKSKLAATKPTRHANHRRTGVTTGGLGTQAELERILAEHPEGRLTVISRGPRGLVEYALRKVTGAGFRSLYLGVFHAVPNRGAMQL